MPHLHLSLQAASDLILKRMKRRHLRADAAAAIGRARALRPGIAIGADLIAGFPTETDALFAETLQFVTEAELPFLHVFPYSERPGTPAARMPAVPHRSRRERAARLRKAGRMRRPVLRRATGADRVTADRDRGRAGIPNTSPRCGSRHRWNREQLLSARVVGMTGDALLAEAA